MRGASPRSGAFWCERSGREERREEPGRLVHAWCDLLRISLRSRGESIKNPAAFFGTLCKSGLVVVVWW